MVLKVSHYIVLGLFCKLLPEKMHFFPTVAIMDFWRYMFFIWPATTYEQPKAFTTEPTCLKTNQHLGEISGHRHSNNNGFQKILFPKHIFEDPLPEQDISLSTELISLSLSTSILQNNQLLMEATWQTQLSSL